MEAKRSDGNEEGEGSTAKLVLVTGATGFIGGHLIRQLLTKGYRVRGTVRDVTAMDTYSYLHRLPNAVNLDIQQANLLDKASWAACFDGVDFVMHVASPYILKPDDPQTVLMEPAVTGTQHILEMCQETASVKKLIFTSCACALSDEFDPDREYDESDWNTTSSLQRNSYAFSKVSAEKLVQAYANKPDCNFKLAVILPATCIGPHIGSKINTSNRHILGFLGKFRNRAIPNFYYSISDVRDVATAHILAMESPRISGRHCIAQAPMHLAEILQIVHQNFVDIEIPTKQMLDFPVKLAMSRDKGYRAEFTKYHLSRPAYINTGKARNCGMFCRPVSQTITDMVRSFQAADLIDVSHDALDGDNAAAGISACSIM